MIKNSILKYVVISGLMMMLVACQQSDTTKKSTNDVNNKTKITNDINKSSDKIDDKKVILASDVTFSTVAFDYELPKDIKDKCQINATEGQVPCPVIDIKLAKVNVPWIQTALNNSITDDGEDRIKFKRALDDFALEGFDEEYVSTVPYEYSIEPEMLKSHNNVAQFSVLTSTYMGGAHGMYVKPYLLYDLDLNSRIELADMYVNTEAANRFYKLAEDAYDRYIVSTEREWNENETRTDAQMITEYKQMYEFELSEDVYFNEKGIVLSYSPYHLGSFAQGFIELEVLYSELQEVLRLEYLPR